MASLPQERRCGRPVASAQPLPLRGAPACTAKEARKPMPLAPLCESSPHLLRTGEDITSVDLTSAQLVRKGLKMTARCKVSRSPLSCAVVRVYLLLSGYTS